ncbi:hypothetical protein [Novosphingobium sp. ZW T3_23]|uniref:hypothetical protein n=1 Tax=Novosphingobium sp. ZW T3_23 TaxID=3378084 RepID=UPI003854C5E7
MSRSPGVLIREQAGHPYRRSLARSRDSRARQRVVAGWVMSGADWRSFLSTYCAVLAAVFAFIA